MNKTFLLSLLFLGLGTAPALATEEPMLPPACAALIDAAPQAQEAQDRLAVPFWKERYNAQKEGVSAQNRTLFFGDSLTQLWEYSGFAERFAAFAPFNLGMNGDTTQNLLWRIENGDLLRYAPANIVLLIGTNNHSSAEEIAGGITADLRALRQQAPSAHLLLIGLLPRGDYLRDDVKFKTVNAKLASCDQPPAIHFVDYSDAFRQADGNPDTSLYASDALHLSAQGYARLGDLIENDLYEKD